MNLNSFVNIMKLNCLLLLTVLDFSKNKRLNDVNMKYYNDEIYFWKNIIIWWLWGAMRCYRNLMIVKFQIKINPLNFDFFCKENYTSYHEENYDKCLQHKDKSRCTEKFKTYYWLIRCLILLSSKFVGLPKELFVLSCI